MVSNTGSDKAIPSRSRSDVVKTACDRCRKSKVKCSGDRPSCQRCLKNGFGCRYDTDDADTSRRLQTGMRLKLLSKENKDLKELLGLLQHRPRTEATEIFTRLRQAKDPLSVLDEVRNAMFLLASPNEHSAMIDKDSQSLDARLLQQSYLKLPTRPWTSVNCPGLVSSLISSFFEWDSHYLLNIIEEDLFVRDMQTCDVRTAKYCSPMLVNAICAFRCHQSSAVRQLLSMSRFNARQLFIGEAKKLYESEASKITLTTVQALIIMFLYHALACQDRAGLMYRYMAFHMVKLLRLEHRYQLLNSDNEDDSNEKRAIKRCLWGLFCADSIIGYPYLQLALMPPPNIPAPDTESSATQQTSNTYPWLQNRKRNSNLKLGQYFRKGLCDLCKLQYEVMAYNEQNTERTENSLTRRRQFYTTLMQLREAISQQVNLEDFSVPDIVLLKSHISLVIYCILQFLSEDTIISIDARTVRDICIDHGTSDIDAMAVFMRDWSHEEYCCSAMNPLYNTAIVFVLLHDRRCITPLLQACKLLLSTTARFSVSLLLLQGIRALAESLGETNIDVRTILETLSGPEPIEDMSMDYTLPQYDQVRFSLASVDGDSLGIRMTEMIIAWTAASSQ